MSDAYRESIEEDVSAKLREKFIGGGAGHLQQHQNSTGGVRGSELPTEDMIPATTEFAPADAVNTAELTSMPEIAPEHAAVEQNRDSMYGRIMSKVRAKKSDDTDKSDSQAHTVARDARTGAMHTDADSQVSHLVDLAVTKGAVHAVKVAQHMENYYILDVLHDKMLADKLHDALVAKNLI